MKARGLCVDYHKHGDTHWQYVNNGYWHLAADKRRQTNIINRRTGGLDWT